MFLSKITEEDIPLIKDMIDVNVTGNINVLAGCLPKMRDKGWGRVILISSVFSEMNVPKNSIYCCLRASPIGLLKTQTKKI